ncbi:MAG: hypothetical protein LAN62_15825 [Acidobacteriia bacterium]|nr:hypothetical protein [Terriglobia bacterium]
MKGSVASLAAKDAYEAALKVERLARAGEMPSAELAFRNLEEAMAQLDAALATLGEEVER